VAAAFIYDAAPRSLLHQTAPSSLPPHSQASAATAVDATATLIQGAAPDTFRLGDVLGGGRFTLRSKIYDGRFATVWRADDAARGAGAVAVLKVCVLFDFVSVQHRHALILIPKKHPICR
jgi:hypothetical protein